MIFIQATGADKTSFEIVADILEVTGFDQMIKAKTRNNKDQLQVVFKLKKRPVMFVNFGAPARRIEFIKFMNDEFGLNETENLTGEQ